MIDDNKKMDYEFQLYGGLTINYQNLYIRSLTINEIRNLYGLSTVLQLMNLSTISHKQFTLAKDDDSLFDLIIGSELRGMFEVFMNVFLEFDHLEYGEKTRSYYLSRSGEIGVLNKDNFEEFLEVFRMAYCIDKYEEEELQCDDKELLELFLKNQEEKEKVDKAMGRDVKITINSMVEAVSNKHNSLNCLNIGQCTIYQIKRDLIRLYQIDSNVYISTGVYTGNIASKDIKFEEFNWAKELK